MKPAIILPDYTTRTVSSFLTLLRTGTTTVIDQNERLQVQQLQVLLACGFSMAYPVHNPPYIQRRKEKWDTRKKSLNLAFKHDSEDVLNAVDQTGQKEDKNMYEELTDIFNEIGEATFTEQNEIYKDSNPFFCNPCCIGFPKETQLIRHVKDVHSQTYKCHLCLKVFKTKFNLGRHINQHMEAQTTTKHQCYICDRIFTREDNLKRHKEEVHTKKANLHQCEHCGKLFQRKVNRSAHSKICGGETNRKECNICGETFGYKYTLNRHIKNKHKVMMNSGSYMIVSSKINKYRFPKKKKEHICYNCPILKKFHSSWELRRHKKIHTGKENLIISDQKSITISSSDIHNRHVVCHICKGTYSCIQNLKEHMLQSHSTEKIYACTLCTRSFPLLKALKKHQKRFHAPKNKKCHICNKCFKFDVLLEKHIKGHLSEKKIKATKNVSKQEQYKRSKKYAENIKNEIKQNPESVRKTILNNMCTDKDFVSYFGKIDPLSETEVINLITDNNLADSQILSILSFLTKKWGKTIVTPNISRKLVKRKSILDTFFTQLTIGDNSEINFKSKEGKVLKRTVVYCHDVPGLLAYRNIVENHTESDDLLNIIGADDGKGMLKITFNWSKTGHDEEKSKLIGVKRGFILAAVCQVPETYNNMHVLIQLTKINEIEYKLSQDLKLTNIVIGITTHSSKYPCPYGECYKDENSGEWIKGKNRTFRNIMENRENWKKKTRSKRKDLKNFKNCENTPLISSVDPDVPIIFSIPPPPLHTILLGKGSI